MSNSMFKRSITVTFQKEGIHRYPAAEAIPGVEFLAHPHRHMFHFTVKLQVFHNDRDVEFILLKRELSNLYNGILEVDFKSCEMLAEELLEYIENTYPNRQCAVSVFEDGENGATVSNVAVGLT